MKTIIIVFITFLVSSLVSPLYASIRYQDLSLNYVPKSYQRLNLNSLGNQSTPGDLGSLRKSILLLRTYLDIFVYAYPINSPDIFEIIRDDLNKLYTSIGNFDDLQNVNYTSSDRDKLLNKCLKDKFNYLQDDQGYKFDVYIKSINDKLYYRNKFNLSRDFWGNVSQIPNETLSGYQNIGLLSQGQLENCIQGYTVIVSLNDIWRSSIHEQFHDYRKLIRASVFIPNFFPDVFNRDVSKDANVVYSGYSKFGKVNDVINEYQYYEKKGYQKEADKKMKQVNQMWTDLKSWLNTDFISSLKDLYQNII